ncbi:acyl-CoA mutase large subunit family protein [Fusibacter paucivorans]|uniref:Acyl-CoA mutase large subunit family protein n=1 Tax=Fusibacter paucivorans TaxID=76009 RepID=A0ABS5PT14_9FIRM|nr:methylmalonyl-CoA mutase family protein [Fusibacter paucivorans]MBS7528314.1 acyl-CoA mutase large subunit family protein [Fusibacter paucivorans]
MKNETDKRQNGYDENGHLFGEFTAPSYEEWQEAVEKLLKGKPFEKAMYTKTHEGITLRPIYRKEDLEKVPFADTLPGYPPFVRGTKAEGNISEPWLVNQEVYAGTPGAFHECIIDELYRGLNVLNLKMDLPSQLGYDADDELAEDVGYRGVSISTLEDLTAAFQELVLDVLPLHINAGMNPIPIMAMIGAYLKKSDLPLANIKGVLGYDPLGMLAKHGQMPFALSEAYDFMADATNWTLHENSTLRTILVEGHPYHDGGADSVQELAYTMAVGTAYIRAMLDRGIAIDDIASKMVFSFSIGSNFFMEISKLRAARILFSKVIEAFGGSETAQKIYLHAKTSSWTKTIYDPYVNMLRNASEGFSGAIAGVDSLTIVPFDEAIREADSFSRRVSRNVQFILQDECNFTQPIDPAGGSWYIETLTHEIAQKAWETFQATEAAGGFEAMLTGGEIQSAIALKYEAKFKDMAKRKHVWVGVNQYANMTEKKLTVQHTSDEKLKKLRQESLQKFRLKRPLFAVADKVSALGDEKTENGHISMPLAIEAIEVGATMGEIAQLCSDLSEQDIMIKAIQYERGASRFEALRDKTDQYQKAGKAPKVFLFNMGPIPQHKGRADFTTGFFEVGGFEVMQNNGFKEVDPAVAAGLASGAQVGVICSTDAVYPEIVPEIAEKIRHTNSNMKLVLAGKPPKDLEAIYRNAGIDDFIYMGADCYGLLSAILENVAEEVIENA